MRGWLGPGLTETWNTLDLLRQHGADYVLRLGERRSALSDEQRAYIRSPIRSSSTTCRSSHAEHQHRRISRRRIIDAFDVLYQEGERSGRVMGIALHPFLIGSPHRIRYLDRALEHIASHDQVWFATGSEIIAAYRAASEHT